MSDALTVAGAVAWLAIGWPLGIRAARWALTWPSTGQPIPNADRDDYLLAGLARVVVTILGPVALALVLLGHLTVMVGRRTR